MRGLWMPTSIRNRSPSLILLKDRLEKFRKPVGKKRRAGLQQKKHPGSRRFSITGHRIFVDELTPRNPYKFIGVSKRRPRSLSRKINVTAGKRRKHDPFGFRATSVPCFARYSPKRSGQRNRNETLPRSELLDWTLQKVQEIKDEIRRSDLAPSALQLTPAIDVMLEVATSPARRFETASELTERKTTLLPLSTTTRKLDRKTIKSGSL